MRRRNLWIAGAAAAFALAFGGGAWRYADAGIVEQETGEVHPEANAAKEDEASAAREKETSSSALGEGEELALDEIEAGSVSGGDVFLEDSSGEAAEDAEASDTVDVLTDAEASDTVDVLTDADSSDVMDVLMDMDASAFTEPSGSASEKDAGSQDSAGKDAKSQGEAGETSVENADLQKFLEGYFTELGSVMHPDSTKTFSHEDFASISGYSLAKWYESKRNVCKAVGGGYADIIPLEVKIVEIEVKGDILEVSVNVKQRIVYAGNADGPRRWTMGYKMLLSTSADGYEVLDMDSWDDNTRPLSEAQKYATGNEVYENLSLAGALVNPRGKSEEAFRKVDEYFEIQEFLEGYFSEMNTVLYPDSTKTFSHSDYASIRGYSVAKWFECERYSIISSYGEDADIMLPDVRLYDLVDKGDFLEACAYVELRYDYVGNTKRGPDTCGCDIFVLLSKEEDGYRVVDMDFWPAEVKAGQYGAIGEEAYAYTSLAEALENQSGMREEDFQKVDEYYEEQKRNILGE